MIKAINSRTGVQSTFSKEQWEKMQSDPYWHGKFVELKDTTPKEVKEIEAKQKVSTIAEVAKRTTSNAEQSIKSK